MALLGLIELTLMIFGVLYLIEKWKKKNIPIPEKTEEVKEEETKEEEFLVNMDGIALEASHPQEPE